LRKKCLAAPPSLLGREEKIERVSLGIDGSIEIHPHFFDFDGGLIHSPGIVGSLEIWPTSLFSFWCMPLDPAVHGGMIYLQPTFQHDFFEVPIAERIPKIPSDTQKNDVRLEVTPFEWVLLYHDGSSQALFLSP
jgi:hypothetical protein